MDYKHISVTKITPRIGAEVSGVDLRAPLSERQFEEVHAALMENLVVFFRDQKLSVAQHKAFGKRFGELHIHPAARGGVPDHPEVLVIHADEKSTRVAGENWHTDVSCEETPPMGSILYMHELPEVGGDTMFADMYAAYETLSEPMRGFLLGLTAVHSSEHVFVNRGYAEGRGYRNEGERKMPVAEHPVVRTHPVTGRKALFVNQGFTTRIVQLTEVESSALLQFLFRHIETPELHCRFRWTPGAIAFWDNRCTQHQAMKDYWPHRRRGHRVTVCGDRPFLKI